MFPGSAHIVMQVRCNIVEENAMLESALVAAFMLCTQRLRSVLDRSTLTGSLVADTDKRPKIRAGNVGSDGSR